MAGRAKNHHHIVVHRNLKARMKKAAERAGTTVMQLATDILERALDEMDREERMN